MPYVEIVARDGEFEIRPMSDASADSLMMQVRDPRVVDVVLDVDDLATLKQHRVFNALWTQLKNDLFRREAHNRGKTS